MAFKTKEAQVLAAAGEALLKVAAERDEAVRHAAEVETKLAEVALRLECEKTAAQMHSKGINSNVDFPELVQDLEKAAFEGRLPVIQEAVKLAAPDMSSKFGRINNDEASSGSSHFEQYLVGSVG